MKSTEHPQGSRFVNEPGVRCKEREHADDQQTERPERAGHASSRTRAKQPRDDHAETYTQHDPEEQRGHMWHERMKKLGGRFHL